MAFVLVVLMVAVWSYFVWRHSGRTFWVMVFIEGTRLYAQLWHRSWKFGSNGLPSHGPVILISNHTSSPDPTFLQTACRNRRLCWLTSREHYQGHRLIRLILDGLLCVPVHRNGQDAAAARGALRRLQQGHALAIFPEGNLSGVAKGRLSSPKCGAAWLALRSGAPVIPAFISGGPQTDELLAAWALRSRRGAKVVVGKPIDLRRFQGRPVTRRLLAEITAVLMQEVRALSCSRLPTGERAWG